VLERTTDVRGSISRYMHGAGEADSSTTWLREGTAFANRWFVPTRFALVNGDSRPLVLPARGDAEIYVEIDGMYTQPDPTLQMGYFITTEDGVMLYQSLTTDRPETDWPRLAPGPVRVRSRIPPHLLNEGEYRLELLVALRGAQWICQPTVDAPAIQLTIQGGLSDSPYFFQRREGVFAPIFPWELMPAANRVSTAATNSALSPIGF